MMNKLFLLLVHFGVITSSLQAQDIHQYYDLGNDAKLLDMTVLPGGSLVAVGELRDQSSTRGWVSMYSATGEVLWTRTTSDPDRQCKFQQVVSGSDSIFYIGGTQFVDSIRGHDLLISKVTIEGQIIWSKIIHGNFQDDLTGMLIYTVWWDPFIQGIAMVGSSVIDSTNTDFLVAVVNDDGLTAYSNLLGGPGIDKPYLFTNKGRQGYICGTTDHDGVSSIKQSAILIRTDLDVIHIDYDLKMKGIGEITPEAMILNFYGFPIIALQDSGLPDQHAIYAFFAQNGLDWASSYNTQRIKKISRSPNGVITAVSDQEILNLDEDGIVLNAWNYNSPSNFTCSQLKTGSNGGYLISGYTSEQRDYPTINSIQDPSLLHCDITNASVLRKGYNMLIEGVSMGITGKGKIDSFDLKVMTHTVDRVINCQTSTVVPIPETSTQLIIYPNPTSDKFTITNLDDIQEIRVYTITGELMLTRYKETTINISDLIEGIYLIQVITDDGFYWGRVNKL